MPNRITTIGVLPLFSRVMEKTSNSPHREGNEVHLIWRILKMYYYKIVLCTIKTLKQNRSEFVITRDKIPKKILKERKF